MCVCVCVQAFTRMLHTIPLTVVESRKEVDEVKELIGICKEYHIALRLELRRKVRASAHISRTAPCTCTH